MLLKSDSPPDADWIQMSKGPSGASWRVRCAQPSAILGERRKNGMVTRIIATNMPVLYLLKSAWQTPIPPNRIIFTGSTKDILDPTGKDDAWITANSYTYELITPPVSWDSAWQLVQQDLKRFTGFSSVVTNTPTDCYILTADTAILALHRSRGGNPVNKLYEPDEQYMQNRPVKTLAYYLDGILDKPVVEETGINYTIDLSLSGINGSNFAAVQSALLAFGFRLTPSQRILPNFIIYQNYKDNE